MIEINVRIKIDTNDPREAYLQVMGALSFSGHKFDVSDYWVINGRPMPKQIARSVRRCRGVRIVTHCVTDAPLPRGSRCIHNEVDFYVGNPPRGGTVPDFDLTEPEQTPMFQAMMVHRKVDFYVASPPARGWTPIDFDIGTAETVPLSAIDAEIYDLMNCLDAPASVAY